MTWTLRLTRGGTDYEIIDFLKEAERKGKHIPDLEDEPELETDLQPFLKHFSFLSRHRTRGMGKGPEPIPLTAIIDYADRVLFIRDREERERFVFFITEMDSAYIDWFSS